MTRWLLVATTGIAVAHAHVASARMTPLEARGSCHGVQQLRDLLLHGDDGGGAASPAPSPTTTTASTATPTSAQTTTAELLATCVHPLLYLSYKWASHADAVAYCKQDACVKVVATLQRLPTCTWQHISSDAESELLVAQRVLEDCVDVKYTEVTAVTHDESIRADDESIRADDESIRADDESESESESESERKLSAPKP